jgi:hypothetical protein
MKEDTPSLPLCIFMARTASSSPHIQGVSYLFHCLSIKRPVALENCLSDQLQLKVDVTGEDWITFSRCKNLNILTHRAFYPLTTTDNGTNKKISQSTLHVTQIHRKSSCQISARTNRVYLKFLDESQEWFPQSKTRNGAHITVRQQILSFLSTVQQRVTSVV